jgi:hypothetical protein
MLRTNALMPRGDRSQRRRAALHAESGIIVLSPRRLIASAKGRPRLSK